MGRVRNDFGAASPGPQHVPFLALALLFFRQTTIDMQIVWNMRWGMIGLRVDSNRAGAAKK